MQLISKYNEGFCISLWFIDICGKYAWVVPLKNKKKGVTITGAFRNFLDEFHHKSNKIWVDKSRTFYNRSMKSWLQDNDMEMYSMQNEVKSLFTERFIIRTSKNKIYKYLTLVSKYVYFGK